MSSRTLEILIDDFSVRKRWAARIKQLSKDLEKAGKNGLELPTSNHFWPIYKVMKEDTFSLKKKRIEESECITECFMYYNGKMAPDDLKIDELPENEINEWHVNRTNELSALCSSLLCLVRNSIQFRRRTGKQLSRKNERGSCRLIGILLFALKIGMMPEPSLKILVCGDVNGQFDLLLKRVNAVNGKNGPFDMLFCVGEFFGPDMELNERIINGIIKMPISTYILGSCCPSTSRFYPEDGVEFFANLTYLGRRGILNTTSGLQVAYVSGIEGTQDLPFQFNQNDVSELLKFVNASTGYLGLDLLLTSMWPAGVRIYVTSCFKIFDKLSEKDVEGSCILSQLAAGLKPRYHFAGMGTHYERTPYRNHRVLQEAAQHVTRFIEQPSNATEFPYMEILARMILEYDSRKREKEKTRGFEGTVFFDMSAEVEDNVDHGGKRRRKNESSREPRIQQPCWFCLSNVDAEQYLIISVADECYLAMPKGPLVDDHVMILSIGHIQSIVAASQEVRDDVKKYKDALTLMFNKQGKLPVFFERNYKTQHLQIQVVPIPKTCSRALRSSFLNAAQMKNIEMVFLEEKEEIWDLVNEGRPYFLVELPDGSRLYSLNMVNFPLQFGREVLAEPALLDCEEKLIGVSASWRKVNK
ncbi:CWF19-like protein 1 [Dirofilaria immitis]|nr:CWF19-like protein 1 [Dirofilaria immitis]